VAAEVITPIDEVSRTPLPILPQEHLPNDDPLIANRHHLWHPSFELRDMDTLGASALRHSRIQLVRATTHNIREPNSSRLTYHDYFVGPPIPQTEQEQFDAIVLLCAGYIPHEAIDMSGDEPRRVEMTPKQRDILRTLARPQPLTDKKITKLRTKAADAYELLVEPAMSQEAYVNATTLDYINQREMRAGFKFHHFSYGYEPIKKFFAHVALSQDIVGVDEAKVEEFLVTHDQERKRYLGHTLLAFAIEGATGTVEETYKRMKKANLLHPVMPHNPKTLVRNKLGKTHERDALVGTLEVRLREQVGLAA